MNMMKTLLSSAQWNGQLLMNKKTQLDKNWKVSCVWMCAQIYTYFFSFLYMFCSPLGPNTEENARRKFVNTHPLVVNMTDIILTRCVFSLLRIKWNLRNTSRIYDERQISLIKISYLLRFRGQHFRWQLFKSLCEVFASLCQGSSIQFRLVNRFSVPSKATLIWRRRGYQRSASCSFSRRCCIWRALLWVCWWWRGGEGWHLQWIRVCRICLW